MSEYPWNETNITLLKSFTVGLHETDKGGEEQYKLIKSVCYFHIATYYMKIRHMQGVKQKFLKGQILPNKNYDFRQASQSLIGHIFKFWTLIHGTF